MPETWMTSLGKHFMDRPLLAQPTFERATMNTKEIRPILKYHRFTVVSKHDIATRVARLLCFCGPHAIARLVIAVCVLTLNRMQATRAFAHISKKVREILPTLAHCNAATAIQAVAFITWIVASATHRTPHRPCRGVGLIMCCLPTCGDFTKKWPYFSGCAEA